MVIVEDEYKIWAVLPPDVVMDNKPLSVTLNKEKAAIISVPDPRLPPFGHRVITKQDHTG